MGPVPGEGVFSSVYSTGLALCLARISPKMRFFSEVVFGRLHVAHTCVYAYGWLHAYGINALQERLVCLDVGGTRFHVDGAALKAHSAYFSAVLSNQVPKSPANCLWMNTTGDSSQNWTPSRSSIFLNPDKPLPLPFEGCLGTTNSMVCYSLARFEAIIFFVWLFVGTTPAGKLYDTGPVSIQEFFFVVLLNPPSQICGRAHVLEWSFLTYWRYFLPEIIYSGLGGEGLYSFVMAYLWSNLDLGSFVVMISAGMNRMQKDAFLLTVIHTNFFMCWITFATCNTASFIQTKHLFQSLFYILQWFQQWL